MATSKRDRIKADRAVKVHKDWYKLDLSAIVYPTLQRRDFSSVYRLSVLLKEDIDPEILQRAVNLTMPRFPTYKAAIRKGVFWRYLEPNDRPGPFVQEDVKNPCQPMYFKGNNRYLVRIYYYRNRIALEAHHSLGDGHLSAPERAYGDRKRWFCTGYFRNTGSGRTGRCLHEICQRQGMSAQTGREDLPRPGDEGTFLYPEYHRRYYVCGGGHESGEKL